jgi:flagellar biosynthetic protein FliQ
MLVEQDFIMYIATEAIYTVLILSAPILLGSLLVGLLVSIFQATTQIQEQTLAFVPKIVAVMIVIAIFGPWMLNVLTIFTANLFSNLHNYTFIH